MIVVFTLNGCPACSELKKHLNKNMLKYEEIEITSYPNVWENVVMTTGDDSVPTVFLKDVENQNKKAKLYVAGTDFNDTKEGINLIKNYFSNKGD